MSLQDARKLDAGLELAADVCIIGSGAAGLTLARELLHGPLRVIVLEAGDITFRHRPQLAYLGEQVGRENYSTGKSRFRMFGGSAARWGKQCRPLDPIDFEARPGVAHTGWPFDRSHLEPYYRRAHVAANLGPHAWQPDDVAGNGARCLPADGDGSDIANVIYCFSDAGDFGAFCRNELAAAETVEVLLNAPVVDIETDAAARRVTGFRVQPTAGKSIRVTARRYVLACGGIENARLLLASNATATHGLGNQHDLVGRFFMDHPYIWAGYLEPADPRFDRSLHVIEDYGQVGVIQKVLAAFTLTEDVRRAEGLNGAATYLVRRPRYKAERDYVSEAGVSFTSLLDVLTHAELPDRRLGQRARAVARDLKAVRTTLGRQLRHRLRREFKLCVRTTIETTPNRDSRITLGDRTDRFGMPRVRVDWRLHPDDRRGLRRLHAALDDTLRKRGIGAFVEHKVEDRDGWPCSLTGGKHHMGTTRMHSDAKQGVVDPNCRVHGMDNLYVAGSSVFPTCGYANPTLTIMALAIRLADRLTSELRKAAPPS